MSFIYLVPLDDIAEGILVTLETSVWQVFAFTTRRLAAPALSPDAYDAQRRQYSSSLILQALIKMRPSDALRAIAVTDRDLFIPMLSFIYGQAQLGGTAAIVSLARLRQEYYGLPPNPPLLLSRASKVIIHETGHTFGLVHCLQRTCPMSLATNIRQLDTKRDELCSSCWSVLRDNIRMAKRQFIRLSVSEDRS